MRRYKAISCAFGRLGRRLALARAIWHLVAFASVWADCIVWRLVAYRLRCYSSVARCNKRTTVRYSQTKILS